MTKVKETRRNLFFYIIFILWAISFSLLGLWLVFRSYTPIPAAAEVAGMVLFWAMVLLIISSAVGCLYIIYLFIRA